MEFRLREDGVRQTLGRGEADAVAVEAGVALGLELEAEMVRRVRTLLQSND